MIFLNKKYLKYKKKKKPKKTKTNSKRTKPLYLELLPIPDVSCVRQNNGSPKISRSLSLELVNMLLSMAKGTLQM